MALKRIINGEEYHHVNPNEVLDNHQFVNLGLPSRLLWSVMNIGSNKITDIGYKFVWGGLHPRNESENWIDYRFVTKYLPTIDHYSRGPIMLNPTSAHIKSRIEVAKLQVEDYAYNHIVKYTLITKSDSFAPKYGLTTPEIWCDNQKVLESCDDAASCIWSGRWRMPNLQEFEELISNCDWDWMYHNGIRCLMGIGPNGNRIYFPMPYTTNGYWSSSLYDKNEHYAMRLSANSEKIEMCQYPRILLNYIRPVIRR